MRKIHALKFELEAQNGVISELIAWIQPDGNGQFLYPAHPARTLLDVVAGDVLIHRNQHQLVVRRLKPWRTSECRDDTQYSEIESGTAWESRPL